MWVPNEKRFGMKAAFIFGSLFALILGGVYLDNDPGVEFYFACLIPAVLFIVSFSFYLKYSSCGKWAIERGWQESKGK